MLEISHVCGNVRIKETFWLYGMSGKYTRAKEKTKVEYDESSDEKDTERSSTTEVTRRGRHAGLSSGQTQNYRAARVYVFGQHDVYEDDDKDIEMSEIRSRKAARNSSYDSGNSAEADNIFFERQIVEEDTLLSIALQYGCPVGFQSVIFDVVLP